MLSRKNTKIGIRLMSILTIWLLISVLFISIVNPITDEHDENIELEKNNKENTEVPQSYSSSRCSRVTRGLADSPWPMFRGNVRHTGLSPYNTSTNQGQLKWKFKTNDYIYPSPAIGPDGTIYIGSGDKNFYAIYPNGTKKWMFTKGMMDASSPAIDSNGTIYVGSSSDNRLYAINPNGTEKWSLRTYGNTTASPVIISNNTIYIGGKSGNLRAIDSNGTQKWASWIGGWVNSPAVDNNGIIYVSSYNKNLYAIYPNGTEKWNFPTGHIVSSSPAIGSDGTIYFGSFDNNVYAINPNGTEEWSFTTDDSVHCSPAIGSDGTIYVGSNDHKLYALNPNGTEKWRFETESWVGSSPAISSEGTIYVGSGYDKRLWAINPNGTEKWNFTTGDIVNSSPAIGSDGTIYVGSYDGYVYAIGNSTPQNQPPIADAGLDQNVYVNQTVNFDGSGSYDADNDTLSFKWSFGDGTSTNWQSNCNSSHVYNKTGKYTVTLFVSDGAGGWPSVNDTCVINVTKGSPLANSPWPKFRGNLRNTGLSPINTSQNPGKLKWSFKTGDDIHSSPVIGSDGTIYIGSTDFGLYAINPNGTKKWIFWTGGAIYSSPAISSDGTIYIGSDDNKLWAINADGTEKWSFSTGHDVHSPPTIGNDGMIYFGSWDSNLYALYPNGTLKWNFTATYYFKTCPAIGYDGVVYVCSEDNNLYAVNPDGTEKWRFPTGNDAHSSPTIGSDGTIYFGSHDHKIWAVNPDGTEKWNFTTDYIIKSSPAIGPNGIIYVGSDDNKLYAINPDGSQKWNFTTLDEVQSSPIIGSEGTIYFGSFDRRFYAVNPNGTEKWNFWAYDKVISSPAISSKGMIYFGSYDGKLYAIGAQTPNLSPIADAGPDQYVYLNQTVYFDGSGSYDPDDDTLTYNWDFGDGTSTNWQNTCNSSHVYNKTGKYSVTLFVTDGAGGWPSVNDTCIIHVSHQMNYTPIIKSNFPTSIILNRNFGKYYLKLTEYESHSNPEITGDNLKWYVTGNSDTIFHITGDNSTGASADTFEFTSIHNQYGIEKLTFHLTDPHGFEATVNQTVIVQYVNYPPIAYAGPDRNITKGQMIEFNGNGSYDIEGNIESYEWTSNLDGKLGNGIRIKTNKLSVGNHTINLNVSDGILSATDTCIIRVFRKVLNLAPIAKISPLTNVYEGKKVQLSANGSYDTDGFIVTYIWDFGDGSEVLRTNKSEVEHTWSLAGNYTIKLTVIDNQSSNGTDSIAITVLGSIDDDPVKSKPEGQGNTFAIILIVIVIIILLTIAVTKMVILRSKHQHELKRRPESDEEMLNNLQNQFLEDETSPEMDYSRNEISELLDRKFKEGRLSEDTYNFIRSEVLFSKTTQPSPIEPVGSPGVGETFDQNLQGKE